MEPLQNLTRSRAAPSDGHAKIYPVPIFLHSHAQSQDKQTIFGHVEKMKMKRIKI